MSKNPYFRGPERPWDRYCRRCNGGETLAMCSHCSLVARPTPWDMTPWRASNWLRRKYGLHTKAQAEALAGAS